MPDPVTIGGALASFGALKNIAQSMIGLRDAQAFQEKMIEFQGAILDAQQGIFSANQERSELLERISKLEKELAELNSWHNEKKRYELTDFGGGTLAYLLRKGMENGEPTHRLCPACYQKGDKSVLQFSQQNAFSQDVYNCPACKTRFNFGVAQRPQNISHGSGESWMR